MRATLELTGDIPAAWRQRVEDVCVVSIGEAESELVRLVAEPTDIVVAPGETARLSVTVGTDARVCGNRWFENASLAKKIRSFGRYTWRSVPVCARPLSTMRAGEGIAARRPCRVRFALMFGAAPA